jgi:hypothetical protein
VPNRRAKSLFNQGHPGDYRHRFSKKHFKLL